MIMATQLNYVNALDRIIIQMELLWLANIRDSQLKSSNVLKWVIVKKG